MKTYIKAEQFKELVARIQSRVQALFPSPMQPIGVLASDIPVDSESADQYGRYPIEVHGVQRKVQLHKDTTIAKGVNNLDLVMFEATEDFTVEGKTFAKGWESLKLATPGTFAPAKAKASKKELVTA